MCWYGSEYDRGAKDHSGGTDRERLSRHDKPEDRRSFQTVLRDRRKLSVADGTASGQTVQYNRGRISGSKIQTEKADIPGF